MESNLLKESWPIPNMKPSTVDGEDNSQNFSVWEENFQDLSSWCMDPFPEQCGFPIGEAINPKLSDTRYENEVSTLEGVPEGFTIVYDENRNCDEDILHSADISSLQGVVKFEDLKPNCSADIKPDVWLNPTTDTTSNRDVSTFAAATTSYTSGRVKPGNLKLNIPLSQVEEVKTVDPLDPAIFSALETNEQESFDLLSYLCDDETSSPSATTSTILEPKLVRIKELNPTPSENEEKSSQKRVKKEPKNPFSPSPSSSSSYLDESIKLSERIEKSQYNSAKLAKDFYKGKRRGVKRILESESEDHEHSDSSYRESREKNNEASRKSRMNKKSKEMQVASQSVQLEKDNKVLKMKVEELEKLVTSLRMALLQSAMKKER